MLDRNSEKYPKIEQNNGNEWMTTKEAAHYLRISPNALRINVCRNKIYAYKFGKYLRFKVKDLHNLVRPKEL